MASFIEAQNQMCRQAAMAMAINPNFVDDWPQARSATEQIRVLNERIKVLEAENQHYRSILSD